MTTGRRTGVRRRAFEPGRRDRLIDVAVQVIGDRGIAGASHRAVADAAGVPLGATTYYFASLEELHAEAFRRHASTFMNGFRQRLEAVRSQTEFVDALLDVTIAQIDDAEALVVMIELYALAVRKPDFLEIANAWIREAHEALAQHVGDAVASAINALMEGVVLHGALAGTQFDRDQLRDDFQRLIGGTASV